MSQLNSGIVTRGLQAVKIRPSRRGRQQGAGRNFVENSGPISEAEIRGIVVERLADDDFVGADQAQQAAGLFVQQVKIEVIVGETAGQVFHFRGLGL